ncbi:MAG: hypothetical protein L6Q73_17575 [Aquabacterium sp.]|nr:hypothetical protein [Aquabacterium sp.]
MLDLGSQWHFERPKLVAGLAQRLEQHQRIAMFGPRQTGKTTLLRSELIPELERRGLLPVYVECWADRKDPIASINHALTKALEGILLSPGKRGARAAKTPVKKVSIAGFAVDLGDLGVRTLPDSPTLRFDALLTMLLEASSQNVALLFDEFQAIAEVDTADNMSAGLRAALTQASDRVGAVFSGSNEAALLRMFSSSRAPLFQFAVAEPYHLLREDFVGHVAAKFAAATQRDLNQVMAMNLLERCGHQPAPFLQVIGAMLSDPRLNHEDALKSMLSPKARTLWAAAWADLTHTQQLTLRLVAAGEPPTSSASREWIASQMATVSGSMPAQAIASSTVDRALKSLQAKGLIAKSQGWEVVDPMMLLWLDQNGLTHRL